MLFRSFSSVGVKVPRWVNRSHHACVAAAVAVTGRNGGSRSAADTREVANPRSHSQLRAKRPQNAALCISKKQSIRRATANSSDESGNHFAVLLTKAPWASVREGSDSNLTSSGRLAACAGLAGFGPRHWALRRQTRCAGLAGFDCPPSLRQPANVEPPQVAAAARIY